MAFFDQITRSAGSVRDCRVDGIDTEEMVDRRSDVQRIERAFGNVGSDFVGLEVAP